MIQWTSPARIKKNLYCNFKKTDKIKTLSALDAASYTINYITNNYPEPYTLYLSGGVDSQAMLYAWKISGVPFDTFSAIYNNHFNLHDLKHLKLFADKHNIKIKFKDFDVITFLETEHPNYANQYLCGSPQITTFMKLADLTKMGTVIMSGNFIRRFNGLPDANNFALYNYGEFSKKYFVPWFFLETGELAHAFTTSDEELIYLTEGKSNIGGYRTKVALYQHNGFPVIEQEDKLNGFEILKEYYDTNPPSYPSIQDKLFRTSNQISTRNFDLLYRNKYEAQFSQYKYILRC